VSADTQPALVDPLHFLWPWEVPTLAEVEDTIETLARLDSHPLPGRCRRRDRKPRGKERVFIYANGVRRFWAGGPEAAGDRGRAAPWEDHEQCFTATGRKEPRR